MSLEVVWQQYGSSFWFETVIRWALGLLLEIANTTIHTMGRSAGDFQKNGCNSPPTPDTGGIIRRSLIERSTKRSSDARRTALLVSSNCPRLAGGTKIRWHGDALTVNAGTTWNDLIMDIPPFSSSILSVLRYLYQTEPSRYTVCHSQKAVPYIEDGLTLSALLLIVIIVIEYLYHSVIDDCYKTTVFPVNTHIS